MNITLVTTNQDKLSEAQAILGVEINSVALELDELQELDPVLIADHKAKQAWEFVKKPVVVWDTSVYISCLNGFPGPLIKWFWQQVTLEKICHLANAFGDNKIYNETILTYFNGKKIQHFRGRWDGAISESPRGANGWAWDKIFIPDGQDKTYAEMDPKDVLEYRSHRLALERLRDGILGPK